MKKNEIEVSECYMIGVQGIPTPVRVLSNSLKRLPDGSFVPSGWKVKSLVSGQIVRVQNAIRFRRKCTEADLAGCKKR